MTAAVEAKVVEDGDASGVLPVAYTQVFDDCFFGDANNDGVVNGSDVLEVEVQFGRSGPADGLLLGDANDDGIVNGSDVLEVEVQFGSYCPCAGFGLATAQAEPAPEPSAGLLSLLLLASWTAMRRSARPRLQP